MNRREQKRAAAREAMKQTNKLGNLKTRTPMMKVYAEDQLDKLNADLMTAQSNLFQAWFQETGFLPSESCVVVERGVFGTRVYPDLQPNNAIMGRLLAAEAVCKKLKTIDPAKEGQSGLDELGLLMTEWEESALIKGEEFGIAPAGQGEKAEVGEVISLREEPPPVTPG